MDTAQLRWWRGPARLEDDEVCFDAAAAEYYDAAQLGPEVLFDLAAVTNAREVVDFVGRYGFFFTAPGNPPREPTRYLLDAADLYRLQLTIIAGMQRSVTPEARAASLPENAQEALHSLAAALLAPPAARHPVDTTLAGIIRQRYEALSTLRVVLARCRNCGRFFIAQHPRARYCRHACAATAAKWRERRATPVR